MQSGDKVKVKIDGIWKLGTVISDENDIIRVMVGEKHYFNRYEADFVRSSVKRFIKIDQEEAILRQKSEFGEIYNLTIELLQKFLPQKKVEVCENVIIKVDDFTLGPCITELESIGMIRQVAGWTVDVAVNYDSPSACGGYDVNIVDLGEFRNGKEAVITLIRSLLGAEVEKYIEKKYEEEMTKYIFSDLPF